MTTYMKLPDRKKQVLKAGIRLAETSHYEQVSRSMLANLCNTPNSNISRVFGSMGGFIDELVQYALDTDNVTVVAQAIIKGHEKVSHLTKEEKVSVLWKTVE